MWYIPYSCPHRERESVHMVCAIISLSLDFSRCQQILNIFKTTIRGCYDDDAPDDGMLLPQNDWPESTPKEVTVANEVFVDMACGGSHTCAVTSTGSILTWGFGRIVTGLGGWRENNIFLQPGLLQDLSSKCVVSVSANKYHTACVTKAGEVFTWGRCREQYGWLGHGDQNDQVKEANNSHSHVIVCNL